MNTFDILSPDGSPIFLANLPNVRSGKARLHHEFVRNEEELQKFLGTFNHPGRASYWTVAQLTNLPPGQPLVGVPGSHRCKDNVVDIHYIWAEVDCKDHPDILPEEIKRKLIEGARPTPSIVISSGHGFHLYWKLAQRLSASPGNGQRRAEELLALACQHVGGDPQVAEVARLMRLPGSHNTRVIGERLPVTFEMQELGRCYTPEELENAWLEAAPVLPAPARKEKEKENGKADSPGVAGTRTGPLEVDAELEAMRFNGVDQEGKMAPVIHFTQLRVSAKLISEGRHLDEVVGYILEATKRAVANDGRCANWDWDDERHAIEKMCYDWINKRMLTGEDFSHCLPDELYVQWQARLEEGKRPYICSGDSRPTHVRGRDNGAAAKEAADETTSEPPKDDAPKAPFVLRPFKAVDPLKIPPREFLYGKHYQRRVVSCTAAPGGTGKSSLVMVEFVAMAIARDLLEEGVPLNERRRVWYHNGEDNMAELERRLVAICQYYDIPQEELEGYFFMTSGNEVPLRVAEGWNQVRLNINHRLIKCITEQIGDNKIDVGGLDPLVTLHGVRESDPGQMDNVLRIFGGIADTANCAIDLSHHTRKLMPGGAEEITIDDVRGAKAISDAARVVRLLNYMSPRDAENAGLMEIERTGYFRVDRGKGNYSAPSKVAIWRRFQNVDLPNGDSVGVVAPWLYPGQDGRPSPEKLEAERRAEQIFLEILRRLTLEGRFVGESGNRNAPYIFAKEREARQAKIGKAALDAAMRRLFDQGRIRIEEYTTGYRNTAHRIVEA